MGAAHAAKVRHAIRQPVVVENRNPQPPSPERSYPVTAERLEARRILAGIVASALSRHGVTQMLGISQQRISRLLSGEDSFPAELLLQIPDAVYDDVQRRIEAEREARRRRGGPPGPSIDASLAACLAHVSAATTAHHELHPQALVEAATNLSRSADQLLEAVAYLAPERKP